MPRTGVHIQVRGVVQGVGFRPFIHKQITDHTLCGTIRNTSEGVEMEIEGEESAVRLFIKELKSRAPALAVIREVSAEYYTDLKNFIDFQIIPSRVLPMRNTLISPDVALCDDCRRELFDPSDRRFRYPFINCTNCGPRFTIIKDVPYDRPLTTMGRFAMCESCEAEYHTITDRRYHAQPVCCPDCGPQLEYYGSDAASPAASGEEALAKAIDLLNRGGILAVKGLGGIHLACRIDDPSIAQTLRRRKQRDEKPFAVMCRDLDTVRKYCIVSPDEEAILCGHTRPIVLLRKKEKTALLSISDNHRIGVMLPYTPLHELLLSDGPDCLIMTSANLSDEPILYQNEEALTALSGIADGFLLHNRDIFVRCDDSLCWVAEGKEYFARRSRGYAPFPVTVKEHFSHTVLACGAEQKASFAISKGDNLFLSQHIGDLKNIATLQHYESQIRHFERLFDLKPAALACDLHPDYLSTEYAQGRAAKDALPLIPVQHHHAHLVSCLVDHDRQGPALGIIWDGTGYGTDGTVWGGEFLLGDADGFERAASLRPFRLPGGDRCTEEIWRIAASLILDALSWNETPQADELLEDQLAKEERRNALQKSLSGLTDPARLAQLTAQLNASLNCPRTTSMGRLFDGVSAILGIRSEAGYEGQAAILLEAAADEKEDGVFPYQILSGEGRLLLDERPLVTVLCVALQRGCAVASPQLAARFMNTLVRMAADCAGRIRKESGIETAALSGGCMQNQYLLKHLTDTLSSESFTVLHHERLSCNDEGIAAGQLAVAEAWLKKAGL
ncbi:MAG: carbamoyltransferase HypF [Lachnospiraceae bacterium]|nr:carbamoyltransferase HypF [Lachnospiraceae bacterium]